MTASTRYIGESIEVRFDEAPELSKSPTCPDALVWKNREWPIAECLEHWVDYGRRGKSAENMRAERLTSAARRGSWGVGKFFFRVRVEGGRIFEFFYDRAPRSASDRDGSWFLRCEVVSDPA